MVSPLRVKDLKENQAIFKDEDVIIANTYSKSVLRTVVEALKQKCPEVYYFPSYEIALNSRQDVSWREDRRHPSGHVVRFITELFLKTYLDENCLPEKLKK